MKKIFYKLFFILAFFALWAPGAYGAEGAVRDAINIYFFYGDGCPHCAKEEIFLDKLEKDRPELNIYRYEVWKNKENADLLKRLSGSMDLNVQGVPLTVIGNKTVSGYGNDETTGKKILSIIKDFEEIGCEAYEDPLLKQNRGLKQCVDDIEECDKNCSHDCRCAQNCGCASEQLPSDNEYPELVRIPFFGEINPKNLSLPLLTVLLAATDGFNPCAMWVLLFLISLLLGMADRKKMWVLGLTFIVSSGVVYFLFMSAWLNLFLFLGYVFWIRTLIGLVAIGSGAYHLYDAYKNRDGGCHVAKSEKRRAVFDRIRSMISKKSFVLSVAGIALLAVAVNLVELVCSAGLPAVYTQVLSLSGLSAAGRYAYLFLYVLIFILDDILVFVIAMSTLQIKAISSRYTSWAQWVGGVLILAIGILLIFKPGWIMFG